MPVWSREAAETRSLAADDTCITPAIDKTLSIHCRQLLFDLLIEPAAAKTECNT
jgi:hypothetical protein